MGENGALGAVRVANEVIASIAALAACEVEGVDSMDEAAARHFGDWVRRQSAHRGVRVHIEGDRSIHLEVFISVDSDAKPPCRWHSVPRERPRRGHKCKCRPGSTPLARSLQAPAG